MLVYIPDEWIARMAGCHPDTKPDQVFKIIKELYPSVTRSFYHNIGKYAVEEAKREP